MTTTIHTDEAILEQLQKQYGKLWNTQQLQEEFDVIGFCAPIVVVVRKDDGVRGSLEFNPSPRVYFNFK